MAIGNKIYLADKATLDKAKNKVDNIYAYVPNTTTTPLPPIPNEKFVADKETLDAMNNKLQTLPQLTLNGNATNEDVLSSKTFYNNSINQQVGNMANNGSIKSTLTDQYGYYTIPKGFHNGTGRINANITNLVPSSIPVKVTVGGVAGNYTNDANVTSNDIALNKIAYAKGDRIVGSNSIASLPIITDSKSITFNRKQMIDYDPILISMGQIAPNGATGFSMRGGKFNELETKFYPVIEVIINSVYFMVSQGVMSPINFAEYFRPTIFTPDTISQGSGSGGSGGSYNIFRPVTNITIGSKMQVRSEILEHSIPYLEEMGSIYIFSGSANITFKYITLEYKN